jgi:hypothetical protein
MPAHGGLLDDHAIASIATYINRRFYKEKGLVASAEVAKLRSSISVNVATMERRKTNNR